jgi:hypothetical protein
VYGLDYQHPTHIEDELKEAPDTVEILATHQVWRDIMGPNYGDAWLHWLPDNYNMILSGDYHSHVERDYGGRKLVSPGPVCMQKINEPSQHSVFVLYDDLSLLSFPLRTRGFYEVRIHDADALAAFIDTWPDHPARVPNQTGVPSNIATNILRVHYRADLEEARERLQATVGYEAHLFLAIMPVENTQVSVDAERRVQAVMGGGLVGCINNFYADDERVRDDAIRLARTRDIKTELTSIFKERLSGSNTDRKRALHEAAQGTS